MTMRQVTIELPTALYEQLQQRAAREDRSVADEVVEAVASSRHPLPASLQELVTSLALLDDAGLQRAAQRHLPERAAQQLEALNHKRQREGLTPSEEETLATLLAQYEQYLLVRAEAASLLKKRGYDVSYLLENDEREG